MAELNRMGLRSLDEYEHARRMRLKNRQLIGSEILTFYLRLDQMGFAIMQPVRMERVKRNLAGLVVDVTLIDAADLTAIEGTTRRGTVMNRIWNAPDRQDGFYCPDLQGNPVYANDGIFKHYFDGVDRRLLESGKSSWV